MGRVMLTVVWAFILIALLWIAFDKTRSDAWRIAASMVAVGGCLLVNWMNNRTSCRTRKEAMTIEKS